MSEIKQETLDAAHETFQECLEEVKKVQTVTVDQERKTITIEEKLEDAVKTVDQESFRAMDAVIEARHLNGSAQFFKMYYPILSNIIDTMSNRELKRFSKMVIGHPLEGNFKPSSKTKEGQAYLLATRLVEARVLMEQAIHMLHSDEQLKKEQESANAQKETVENGSETKA